MPNRISAEIEKTLDSLKLRGINAIYAENRDTASNTIRAVVL